MPVFSGQLAIDPYNLPRFIFFSVVLLTGMLFLLKRTEIVFPPLLLFLLLLAFYLANLASTLWALNKSDAVYESQKVFLGLSTIAFFLNYIRSDEDEAGLIKSLLWVALICCLYPTIQLFGLSSLNAEELNKVTGFSEQRGLLSLFLMLLLPVGIYGATYIKGAYGFFGIFICGWLLVLIVLLKVMPAWLGTTVGLTVYGICRLTQKAAAGKRKRVHILIVCGFLLVVGGSYFILPESLNPLGYFFSPAGIEHLKIWKKTWQLTGEYPLFGVGAANWQYLYLKYGVSDLESLRVNHVPLRPQNDILWVLAETGISCFVILILKMFTILYFTYKGWKSGNPKVVLFFSFLCALITAACFSFPKERMTHIVFSCLLLALLLRNLPPGCLMIRRSTVAVTGAILFLFFGLVVGVVRLYGEYHTRQMFISRSLNDTEGAVHHGEKALTDLYRTEPFGMPVSFYISNAYAEKRLYDNARRYNNEAYRFSPYNVEVLAQRGELFYTTGSLVESKRILLESYRINRFHEKTLLTLARVDYELGNYTESLEWLNAIPGSQARYSQLHQQIKSRLSGL